MKFIKVTKNDKKRNRGIIAVDAICSAFEDQEKKCTTIMTMDGFWYEVVDDIEKVLDNVVDVEVNDSVVPQGAKEFCKKHRMQSPALSEKGGTPPMERQEMEELEDKEWKPGEEEKRTEIPTFSKPKKFGQHSHRGKYGRKVRFVDGNGRTDIAKNLPPGGGEGHHSPEVEFKEGGIPRPADLNEGL